MKHDIRILNENFQTALKKINNDKNLTETATPEDIKNSASDFIKSVLKLGSKSNIFGKYIRVQKSLTLDNLSDLVKEIGKQLQNY